MNYFLLIAGILIVVVVLQDFMFTTLSGQGSGFITHAFNRFVFHTLRPKKGHVLINSFGFLHLIGTLTNWILLILGGSYLIFLSHPDFVMNSFDNTPADGLDRLYYTIYVFSTLGNGDFLSGEGFGRIYTALLSLIGFGMLTTAITYMISVTGAALNKRNLSVFISIMADTPISLYHYAMQKEKGMMLLEKCELISEKLIMHANNHLSYPIIHFFLTTHKRRSLSLHVATLYETTVMIRQEYESDNDVKTRCDTLINAIFYLLSTIDIKEGAHVKLDKPDELRHAWSDEIEELKPEYWDGKTTNKLTSFLYSQGWQWKDVYH